MSRIVRPPLPGNDYSIVHNTIHRDSRVSHKAKGLFHDLMAMPPWWDTTAEKISRQGVDGIRSVKGSLSELEKHGYLTRKRRHDPKTGQWVHEHWLNDQPNLKGSSEEEPLPPQADYPPAATTPNS